MSGVGRGEVRQDGRWGSASAKQHRRGFTDKAKVAAVRENSFVSIMSNSIE